MAGDPRAPIERIVVSIVRDMLLLASPTAVLISIYYALWGGLPGHRSRLLAAVGNIVLFVMFAVVLAFVGRWRLRRLFARRLGWLVNGTAPRPDDESALQQLPARVALEGLAMVVVVALITALVALRGIASARSVAGDPARVFVGITLFGSTSSILAYLVAERCLRPVFAIGLVSDRTSGVGVRVRLVLAWLLGSGVPLLFIVAVPLRGQAGRQLPVMVPVTFMALTALVTGAVTTAVVAASIADPLNALRAALKGVGSGNLGTELPVTDPGDLGLVQRSFNRMVVGLRERRKLEDLFGRHVGEEIAQRALRSEVVLGGELREVSVLFVDIAGSTAFAESNEPQDVVAVLNRFFAEVVAAVRNEGGWVNKFEGDAALCVFGAPSVEADHAARALRDARQLSVTLRELPLRAGIGVSSGEVVAGNVGAEDRYEYTVIGSAVNESARLADVAKEIEGGVVASGAAIERAGAEAATWRSSGEVVLRGLTRPVAIGVPERA